MSNADGKTNHNGSVGINYVIHRVEREAMNSRISVLCKNRLCNRAVVLSNYQAASESEVPFVVIDHAAQRKRKRKRLQLLFQNSSYCPI